MARGGKPLTLVSAPALLDMWAACLNTPLQSQQVSAHWISAGVMGKLH